MTTDDRFVSGVSSAPTDLNALIERLSARTRTATGKRGAEDDAIQKAGIDAEQSVTKPSPAWQLIETAPHNTSVLLGWRDWRDGQWCMEVGPASTGQRYDNGYSDQSYHGSATHWRPRPEPPDDAAKPDVVAPDDTGGEA